MKTPVAIVVGVAIGAVKLVLTGGAFNCGPGVYWPE